MLCKAALVDRLEKLTRSNYLLWQSQVLPPIRGARLTSFLDTKTDAPPETITVEKGMVLKRFTARAKGRGNRIVKPTCHIFLTVGN